VEEHLASRVGPSNDAPFFTGPGGGRLGQLTLNHAFQAFRQTIGRPELRFHDCRHSGLAWSAASGASTAEIMRRAGHKSAAAAMRHQHATSDRDAVLAAALSQRAQAAPVITHFGRFAGCPRDGS
jgi:integrase